MSNMNSIGHPDSYRYLLKNSQGAYVRSEPRIGETVYHGDFVHSGQACARRVDLGPAPDYAVDDSELGHCSEWAPAYTPVDPARVTSDVFRGRPEVERF
ncbi:MAG: hypothetical protein AB1758_07085 [Candidatus Eremiobacterota bacterium]